MQIPINTRIAIAGSVNSSKRVLEKLIEHEMNVVRVYGLSPEVSQKVSGYQDLRPIAENADLSFQYFDKINNKSVIQDIKNADVDILFVVGLSQLISQELINSVNITCIGYHPTKLPKGRGRAALAWIVLEEVEAAATFFEINEGVDSGDIFVSEPVLLAGNEYAKDVLEKLMFAIDKALDKFLPKLKIGEISKTIQDHSEANYLEIRRPNDGYIDWKDSAFSIQRIIRAVSKPLPGAFTYFSDKKIYIWRANYHEKFFVKGVVGRVLRVNSHSFFVQTGEGVLEVLEYTLSDNQFYIPKVGDKLGLDSVELLKHINYLNNLLNRNKN